MQQLYGDHLGETDRLQVDARFSSGMDFREFGIRLGVGELHRPHIEAELAKTKCYGAFVFSQFGVWEYAANGECVNDLNNAALQSTLRANARWTDEQIRDELIQRKALFGPTATVDIQTRIPSTGLVSDTVGELVELRTVQFNMPDRVDGQIVATDAPGWKITYEVVGKPRVIVVITLEPFDGRLRRMMRIPPE